MSSIDHKLHMNRTIPIEYKAKSLDSDTNLPFCMLNSLLFNLRSQTNLSTSCLLISQLLYCILTVKHHV